MARDETFVAAEHMASGASKAVVPTHDRPIPVCYYVVDNALSVFLRVPPVQIKTFGEKRRHGLSPSERLFDWLFELCVMSIEGK
jgi:hypothetical protein